MRTFSQLRSRLADTWPLRVASWTLVVLVWLWLGLLSGWLPDDGEVCHKNEYTEQKECAIEHVSFVFFRKLGKILDDMAPAITGFATVILAVFTVVLARATDRLKAIGSRQIDALENLERPWIFIAGTHIKRREDAGDALVPNYYWIRFHCKNIGRAPAIIEEFIVKIGDVKKLPKVPDYRDPIELHCQQTISVGEPFKTNTIGPPTQPGIDPNKATEYAFYGRVTYRELNGKTHHSWFAVQVSPMMAASMQYPGEGYNRYD